MPFNRPSLPELINQIRADFLQRFELEDPLRRADAEVHARVASGAVHALYGYLDWISRQVIPDTAEGEYLERWTHIWGITRKPSAKATGSVTFTVQSNALIPAGTRLQALDGVLYETTEAASGSGSTYTARVAAVIAAESGNRAAGELLSLVSPVPGVQSSARASAFSGGADQESDDALRVRLLARIHSPPQGGSQSDYEAWALEVPGVTRAWCSPSELGAGTVVLRFVRDNDDNLIPDAQAVAAVQRYIEPRRPVTAQVTVKAPEAVVLNFEIAGLKPNTTAVKEAIKAELSDLIQREAVPGGTLYLSHIRAAISAATDETDFQLTSPTGDVVRTLGQIVKMGTVTWV